MVFIESILWYVLFFDAVVYNIMAWTSFHTQQTHWATDYVPLHRVVGFLYAVIMVWLGFALYRLELLGFHI
ncbi:MAG TPA: hypothetical protein VJI32_01930 [Candidatus Nanoarchaeia archaeon]|nr:hypothetical protein [Candidatus Nanoarchaeia archaeon]